MKADPAAMLTLMFEPWAALYPACEDLWAQHYEEFRPFHGGRLPMGPDIDGYRFSEERGQLLVLIARLKGDVVGYMIVKLARHPHYIAMVGLEDSYYLRRDCRVGTVGLEMIQAMLDECWRRGTEAVFIMSKQGVTDTSPLLERLGGVKSDSLWVFWKEVA